MDNYKELAQLVRSAAGKAQITLMQGIVRKVSGLTCEVEIGGIAVPDVRLRASEAADGGQMLVTPKIGSAVIVGSLSGDLTQLGGLINIEQLTQKINELVQAFNAHTRQGFYGPTGPPLKPAQQLNKSDYEDTTIKH